MESSGDEFDREPITALGIDVGSSNVKTVLLAEDGNLIASTTRPLRTTHDGDAVTQDPAALWQAVRDSIIEIVNSHPAEAALVSDIGVCSQYSSVVAVDGNGVPVSPIIMYMDRRGTDACWSILEKHPEAFEVFIERHGIPPIGAGLTLSHILSIEHDQHDVDRSAATYLEVMDFVNLLLTGRAAATQATMFAAQVCDNRLVGVTSYDEDLVEMAGINVARLPELLNLGMTVGVVREPVAKKLGLPKHVKVRVGMNDTQAAGFATGVFAPTSDGGPHRVGVMIGTTAVITDLAPGHKVDLDRQVLTMPSPIPGRHMVMAENGLAGRAVEHFMALMGIRAFESGDFEGSLTRSAPGARGVLFMPWLSGSMSPSEDASIRGGMLGLSLTTTRDDLVRAAVEGTALNLGWLLPAVEELTGAHADRITFGGGAARSPGWAQILADVLQRPVDVPPNPELAAAIATARVAMARSLRVDPAEITPDVVSSYEPDPSLADLYRNSQEQLVAAFSQNRGICEDLGHG